jgi:hypothetical protein
MRGACLPNWRCIMVDFRFRDESPEKLLTILKMNEFILDCYNKDIEPPNPAWSYKKCLEQMEIIGEIRKLENENYKIEREMAYQDVKRNKNQS